MLVFGLCKTDFLFVDDSTIFLAHYKISEIHQMLTVDLGKLKWFEGNRLVLNTNKTKFVLFHNTEAVAVKF